MTTEEIAKQWGVEFLAPELKSLTADEAFVLRMALGIGEGVHDIRVRYEGETILFRNCRASRVPFEFWRQFAGWTDSVGHYGSADIIDQEL